MSEYNKKTTISDVALAAGVSKTTVSRYLNGKYELMSEKTRLRIAKVVEMTAYRPSDVARALKSRQSSLVGVIIADISTPFSSALIAGVERVLDGTAYSPIFVNSENRIKKEYENIKKLLGKGVEGLLINSCAYENPKVVELDLKGFPIVLLDREIKDHRFDIVTSEIKNTLKALLSHLKEEGFSLPYLFTQELSISSTRQLRYDAFLDAAAEIFGASDPVELVRNIDMEKPERTEKYISELLGKDEIPAFVGVNTMTTLHIVNYLKKLGAEIPRDAGVCGPDDWSWGQRLDWASMIYPGVTTCVINSQEIGERAAGLLLSRITDNRREKNEVILDCDIVKRKSTKRD